MPTTHEPPYDGYETALNPDNLDEDRAGRLQVKHCEEVAPGLLEECERRLRDQDTMNLKTEKE